VSRPYSDVAKSTWVVLKDLAGLRPGRIATPLAAALIIAVMTAAVAQVHWRQGLWITEGG
jgi:hypothetical protein